MTLKSLNIGAFVLAGVMALSSCTNTAHIEKSKGANLAAYKTYSWVLCVI